MATRPETTGPSRTGTAGRSRPSAHTSFGGSVSSPLAGTIMEGRAFLDVADELGRGSTEAHWRAAAGRAYYALVLEGRDALESWGVPIPAGETHRKVRLCFVYARDSDLLEIAKALERLGKLRSRADYELATSGPGPFDTDLEAQQAIDRARVNLARLDRVKGDAARCSAA